MTKFECTINSDSISVSYDVYACSRESAKRKAVQMFEDDYPELFHVEHVTAVRV